MILISGLPSFLLLDTLRQSLFASACRWGSMPADESCAAIAAAGLGTDVAKGAARSQPARTAVLQLRWPPGTEPPEPGESGIGSMSLIDQITTLSQMLIVITLRLARACDRWLGDTQFEHLILQSGTAKARLIHYCAESELSYVPGDGSVGDLGDWSNWHKDYGLFTALLSPQYGTDGEHGLDDASKSAGLVVLPASGAAQPVSIPRDCIAVQVSVKYSTAWRCMIKQK